MYLFCFGQNQLNFILFKRITAWRQPDTQQVRHPQPNIPLAFSSKRRNFTHFSLSHPYQCLVCMNLTQQIYFLFTSTTPMQRRVDHSSHLQSCLFTKIQQHKRKRDRDRASNFCDSAARYWSPLSLLESAKSLTSEQARPEEKRVKLPAYWVEWEEK